ncbi:MAG TPA: hypothetical protein VK540_27335 [Polyangiaceae bacterium]|nr:hypothetical protein [Polyangiaceae bacterium]
MIAEALILGVTNGRQFGICERLALRIQNPTGNPGAASASGKHAKNAGMNFRGLDGAHGAVRVARWLRRCQQPRGAAQKQDEYAETWQLPFPEHRSLLS